jgi:hypothetical protein
MTKTKPHHFFTMKTPSHLFLGRLFAAYRIPQVIATCALMGINFAGEVVAPVFCRLVYCFSDVHWSAGWFPGLNVSRSSAVSCIYSLAHDVTPLPIIGDEFGRIQ